MEKVILYTNGVAAGKLGPAVIGVSIEEADGKVVKEIVEAIGNATNEYAEYFAVVRALQIAEEIYGAKTRKLEFEIRLCHELVKQQLNNEAPIKDVSLIGHFIEIHNLGVASFPQVIMTQVSLASNQANQLVKESLAA